MGAAKTKAREMASEGKEQWVLDHLPQVLHSQDFRFNDEDLPQRRLIETLIEAAHADGKTFIYEERLLRITVSERLFLLDSLTDVKEVGQVFLIYCSVRVFSPPFLSLGSNTPHSRTSMAL